MFVSVCAFFFFKQKTAYEMRISDWSSDVCSSDLAACDVMPPQLAAMPEVSDHFQATQQAGDASFLRAGYGPDLLRGLRRGKWPVQASLDLQDRKSVG